MEQNYDLAAKYFKDSADKDYTPAQVALGRCYDAGLGVERDAKEAFRHFLQAAKKEEDDYAMFVVGSCYEQAKGVERDVEAARVWYSKAAKDGYADAINALHDLEGLMV